MREPYVAGKFYPGSKGQIVSMLEKFKESAEKEKAEGKEKVKTEENGRSAKGFRKEDKSNEPAGAFEKVGEKEEIFSCVSPHAGWSYSGFTAMHTFLALKNQEKRKKIFAILSPNHTGFGTEISISQEDWKTPLGTAKCAKEVADSVVSFSEFAQIDEEAHRFEHSVEVQLPFLQFLFPDFSFVAITFLRQDLETAKDIANALAKTEKKLKTRIQVVASSDFTHYEQAKAAREKDMEAIGAICSLDAEKFISLKQNLNASICGYAPIASAMLFAELNGGKKGKLLHFSDSGEVSGDKKVVDYASIAFV